MLCAGAAPPQLHHEVLAADRVGAAVQHVGGGDAAGEVAVDVDVRRIEDVLDAGHRADGRPTLVDRVRRDVRVGVDDAGRDELALAVDHRRARRRVAGALADEADRSAVEHHGAVLDALAGGGQHRRAADHDRLRPLVAQRRRAIGRRPRRALRQRRRRIGPWFGHVDGRRLGRPRWRAPGSTAGGQGHHRGERAESVRHRFRLYTASAGRFHRCSLSRAASLVEKWPRHRRHILSQPCRTRGVATTKSGATSIHGRNSRHAPRRVAHRNRQESLP
jgi:hypothetical protein